jgi:large subunit ribosomal protein L10
LNRNEKAAAVDEIAAQIEASEAIFAIDYRGISVPEAAALRGSLREADTSFRIVKNRLTKLAAEKAGREELNELLEGPTALAFIRGDTAMAAKAIFTFNREHEVLTFKGGFMDGLTLDEETFASIARLPSRDVLNGQFAGVVASPLTGLVRGLGSMVSGLAVALQQIADQGLVSGEPPPEGSEASAAGPVAEEDTSSSQAAGEEPTSTPPAEEESEPEAPEPEGAEAPQPEAEAQEPQPDADPDAPGREAEEASGSDSEESSSGTGPAAEAPEPSAEEPEASEEETSEQPEASNEEE